MFYIPSGPKFHARFESAILRIRAQHSIRMFVRILTISLWATTFAAVAFGQTSAQNLPPTPRLGCFYFPGWYTADRWAPIGEYGGRDPLLGYYRDALPEVQDWHIRQATQHGISFWVFDWYFDSKNGTVLEGNAALDSGFLKAKLRDKMDFALMWCNEEAGAPTYTEAEIMRMVRIMDERYFSRSNYLRTPDGRRVLVISRPDRLVDRFGAEGTRSLLKKMSAAVQNRGGLFFVSITDPGVKDLSELPRIGIDAGTLYCYSSQGLPPGAAGGPYDTLLPAARSMWERGKQQAALPLIPTVSPDWDSRAWYGDRATWRSDPTPEKFEALCRIVKPYIDPRLGMALVGTWNEFGEGSYIEPTRQRGYAYLDALQRVFFPHLPPHRHPSPTAAELARMAYHDIPTHLEKEQAAQGGNLLINPGFEREWGWTYFDASPIAFTQTNVHSGKRALVLSKERGGVKSQMLEPGIPWPSRWTNRIPILPGAACRVRAWVNGKASLTCALFDRNGAWLNRYHAILTGGETGRWQELSGLLPPDDPEAAYFDVEVVPQDRLVYVDDISVQRTGSDSR